MNRAPLLSTSVALVIGVVIAGIVACGGGMSAKRATMSPRTDGGTPLQGGHDPRIEKLDAAITAEFAKLGEPRPVVPPVECPSPPCAMPTVRMEPLSVKPTNDPACKPGAATTCKDTCTLADSICDNAESICKIAKELGNDAWATGKCTDGETSCKTAHDRCCGCL